MTIRVYRFYPPPLVRLLGSKRSAMIRSRFARFNRGRARRVIKV